MNVIDALRKRRAVKRFDPAFQLSEDDKKQLLQEVLANAPSAFNLQHWRPVIVEDAELRQKNSRDCLGPTTSNRVIITDCVMCQSKYMGS